jgi:hypothetical protein
MRNASITNALNTNASAKAVISHSHVLAISAARSFNVRAALYGFSSLSLAIRTGHYADKLPVGQNFLSKIACCIETFVV